VISGDVQGGDSLEELVRQLQTLEDPDMYELALDLKEVIVAGNREGLLAGLDADGVPMAELEESTIKRGRGGYGPPTIPRYSASQLIDRFRAEIMPSAQGRRAAQGRLGRGAAGPVLQDRHPRNG
jgi:hypothetical protein